MSRQGYSTYEARIRAVKAVARGVPVGKAAKTHGADRTTIFRWVRRHDQNGEDGLRRTPGSGRPRKLPEWERKKLWRMVLQSATQFGAETGLWTVSRVHRVLRGKLKSAISRDTVWRRFREAGLACRKPERQSSEIEATALDEWRRREAPRIRRTVVKYRAILFYQDAVNVSLKAFVGSTGATEEKAPKTPGSGHNGGLSAIFATSRRGRLLFALHRKRIASEEIMQFFDQLLRHHPRRHLVVVSGREEARESRKMLNFIESQPRLHVFYMPRAIARPES